MKDPLFRKLLIPTHVFLIVKPEGDCVSASLFAGSVGNANTSHVLTKRTWNFCPSYFKELKGNCRPPCPCVSTTV